METREPKSAEFNVNMVPSRTHSHSHISLAFIAIVVATIVFGTQGRSLHADDNAEQSFNEPVVARVEMKLVDGEKVIDVIEKGDLLTVVKEREKDYVILTHDGAKGAVAKVNAVRVIESLDIYSELIRDNPKEGRYHTLRASAHWAMGKPDNAIADFDRAIELGYKEAHAYASRGLFYAATGKHDKAIADYNEALQIDPEDLGPMVNRAAVHMAKGEFAKAIEDYTEVLKKREGDTSILHQRAIAFKAAGKTDEAAADFTAILKSNPKDFRAVMGRGYLKFQEKDHEGAIEDFGAALKLNPKDAVAWNNRGYNRAQLGKHTEALKDYEKAIELSPKYALALQNIAWLLATVDEKELRDPKRAVEMAKRACKQSDYQSIGDLSALAAALAANKQFDEAVGWQEKVVAAVDDRYKMFARKTLERYEAKKPFVLDPIQAEKDEAAAAESDAKKKAALKDAEKEAAGDAK